MLSIISQNSKRSRDHDHAHMMDYLSIRTSVQNLESLA